MAPWWSPRALARDADALEQQERLEGGAAGQTRGGRAPRWAGRARRTRRPPRRAARASPRPGWWPAPPRGAAGATCGCRSSPTRIIPRARRNPSASTRSTSSPEHAHERLVVDVVAPDGGRLQHATRVGGEALDAHGDDVGERRRGRAPDSSRRKRRSCSSVERHDRARPAEQPAELGRPMRASALSTSAVRQRREHARRGDVGRPAGVEAGRVGARRAARGRAAGRSSASANALRLAPSTRVEVVDREDDAVAARPLARAHERPAQRLGRGEAAVFGREAGAALGGSLIRRRRRGRGAPRAWRPTQSRGPPPVTGRRRELHDGAAERPVADLGPRRVGPRLHDDVARGGRARRGTRAPAASCRRRRRRRCARPSASAPRPRRASSHARSSSRPMSGRGQRTPRPRRRRRRVRSARSRRAGDRRRDAAERRGGSVVSCVAVVGAPHSPQNFCAAG